MSRKKATVSSTGNARSARRISDGLPPQKSFSVTIALVTLQRVPPRTRIFAPGARAPSSSTTDRAALNRRAKIAVARPAAPAPTIATSHEGGRSKDRPGSYPGRGPRRRVASRGRDACAPPGCRGLHGGEGDGVLVAGVVCRIEGNRLFVLERGEVRGGDRQRVIVRRLTLDVHRRNRRAGGDLRPGNRHRVRGRVVRGDDAGDVGRRRGCRRRAAAAARGIGDGDHAAREDGGNGLEREFTAADSGSRARRAGGSGHANSFTIL